MSTALKEPGWWYLGPWVIDAYEVDELTVVVARGAENHEIKCGWILLNPPRPVDIDTLASAAATGVPVSVPVTGIIAAVVDGLGLNPTDLLAALLAEGKLSPETVASVAPLAGREWVSYGTGKPLERLANYHEESHVRESMDAPAFSPSTAPSGDASRAPTSLDDSCDALVCNTNAPDRPEVVSNEPVADAGAGGTCGCTDSRQDSAGAPRSLPKRERRKLRRAARSRRG